MSIPIYNDELTITNDQLETSFSDVLEFEFLNDAVDIIAANTSSDNQSPTPKPIIIISQNNTQFNFDIIPMGFDAVCTLLINKTLIHIVNIISFSYLNGYYKVKIYNTNNPSQIIKRFDEIIRPDEIKTFQNTLYVPTGDINDELATTKFFKRFGLIFAMSIGRIEITYNDKNIQKISVVRPRIKQNKLVSSKSTFKRLTNTSKINIANNFDEPFDVQFAIVHDRANSRIYIDLLATQLSHIICFLDFTYRNTTYYYDVVFKWKL